MSSSDIAAVLGLATDAVLLAVLHYWVKRLNRSADEIEAAPHYKPGSELVQAVKDSESGYLAYASVEGEVMPINQVLTSQYAEGKTGVMKEMQIIEHKSKRLQGVWSDVKNTIQDKLEVVPFFLRRWLGHGDNAEIHVQEPTEAKFLLDDLTTTYDHFEPSQAGFLSRGVDHLFGESTKGVHKSERMLAQGTILLGVGEIALVNDQLHLRPPQSGSMYILTTMSKAEVIKRLVKRSFWVWVFEVLTAAVGIGIAVYLVKKYYKKWQQDQERSRVVREVRQLRDQATSRQQASRQQTDLDTSDDTNCCVVCLCNHREIVLLNCGHLCLCAECLAALPVPLTCPVCRQSVERWVTTYNP